MINQRKLPEDARSSSPEEWTSTMQKKHLKWEQISSVLADNSSEIRFSWPMDSRKSVSDATIASTRFKRKSPSNAFMITKHALKLLRKRMGRSKTSTTTLLYEQSFYVFFQLLKYCILNFFSYSREITKWLFPHHNDKIIFIQR